MGFFDGLGPLSRRGRRRRGTGLAVGADGDIDVVAGGSTRAEAEADATRIRLSEHLYEGVSRVPPSEADDARDAAGVSPAPIPDDKPDPRAQWDGVRGCWILWNPDHQAWEALDDTGTAG